MLLELFRHWSESVSGFSVFNYLTLRALLAALTALFIGFAAGPAVIRKLRAMHFGQAVRTDGPKSHLVKDGTPTMGGALMLAGIGVSTLLWADLSNRFVWVTLFVTMGYGLVGWIDDYRKVVHHNPKGMSAREVRLAVAHRPRGGRVPRLRARRDAGRHDGRSLADVARRWDAA